MDVALGIVLAEAILWLAQASNVPPTKPEASPAHRAASLGQPLYDASGIANAAANVTGLYAPNTFVSIYGNQLSRVTQGITAADIRASELPDQLLDSGVRVYLGLTPAHIFFVSPGQVNILVPSFLTPSTVKLQLTRDGLAGPAIPIRLSATAPSLFEYEGRVIATRVDGSLVTPEAPARRGEVIVLWATGLGRVEPPTEPNRIPNAAARLANLNDFLVLVGGIVLPRDHILYAGVAPGFAGLYQINVRLPENCPDDPEIRVGTLDLLSPAGRGLSLR